MKAIHEQLAMIGLRAAEHYGFALAGGYAITAHGMGNRPSLDVDLFTDQLDPDRFAEAVHRVRTAFAEAGFDIEDTTIRPTFVDMRITDRTTGESSDIQLGVNYREFPPARMEIGAVLDARDAVAGKMSALWSRGEVRDFIDIDTVIESGRFTREEILAIGDQQESLPMDRRMLMERFRSLSSPQFAARYDPVEFADYGVDAERRTAIIERFAQWASEIDPSRPREASVTEAVQERAASAPSVGPEAMSAVRASFPHSPVDAVGAPRPPQPTRPRAYRPPGAPQRGHDTGR
jgi:hypothetical protein